LKLSILEFLGVDSSGRSEQQSKRDSDCCLAADLGEHRAGCQGWRKAYSGVVKDNRRNEEIGSKERCMEEMKGDAVVFDTATVRG
jgi:hypothetical protein